MTRSCVSTPGHSADGRSSGHFLELPTLLSCRGPMSTWSAAPIFRVHPHGCMRVAAAQASTRHRPSAACLSCATTEPSPWGQEGVQAGVSSQRPSPKLAATHVEATHGAQTRHQAGRQLPTPKLKGPRHSRPPRPSALVKAATQAPQGLFLGW